MVQVPAATADERLNRIAPRPTVRLWLPIGLLIVFWSFIFGANWLEMSMFVRFVSRWAAYAILFLAFFGWWLLNGRVSRRDRWSAVGIVLAGALLAGVLAHPTINFLVLLMAGLPLVITVWTAWLVLAKRTSPLVRRVGFLILTTLTWAGFDFIRWNGLDGGQHADYRWRWSPTAEELFLAENPAAQRVHSEQEEELSDRQPASDTSTVDVPATTVKSLEFRPGDWPEFRGSERNGRVSGTRIAADWNDHPPRKVWSRRVGPAWSSMIVVDGLLFTQEQRGDSEATVAYDAATGSEVWVHAENQRFAEQLSGAGPRATPTFHNGRLYTLGGLGQLNCLDALTGRLVWSRSVASDSGAATPQWAFCDSPLVDGDIVIAYAGGEQGKGLLAYHADSGEPAWASAVGKDSYSSPQLTSIDGVTQILMLSSRGLTAVDPAHGNVIWEYLVTASGPFQPILQPQSVSSREYLIQSPVGVALVGLPSAEAAHSGVAPATATQLWESNALKPSLGDFVVYEHHVYGFDDGIFCCVDARTGKRAWKKGRYGHGQVLLLADQGLLLVSAENGEAVLLRANPERLEELGRFQAVEGKTWNHPCVAHDLLYFRNDEEMACYQPSVLPPEEATADVDGDTTPPADTASAVPAVATRASWTIPIEWDQAMFPDRRKSSQVPSRR